MDIRKNLEGNWGLLENNNSDYLLVQYFLNKLFQEREERNVQQDKSVLQEECENNTNTETNRGHSD